jgi:hypothetical protein
MGSQVNWGDDGARSYKNQGHNGVETWEHRSWKKFGQTWQLQG